MAPRFILGYPFVLLLVFFLVTTTISMDKGIKHTYKNGSPMKDWISKLKTKEIITETMKNNTDNKYKDDGGLLDENNLITDETNVE